VVQFKIFFENALGLIETINFDELGPVSAKVDSGNGAYNVLHATGIQQVGKDVQFITVNGKTLKKPVQEMIDINIGSGNVEHRPVVLFDISIGGKKHPNTPFSLADRSDNDEKVLIGKDFVQKLGGIIDVNKKNNLA